MGLFCPYPGTGRRNTEESFRTFDLQDSWEELRTGDTKLIRDWVRMMASAGWNAICPSEVNWHYTDNFLEHLDEVEILAGILRDYGMKLYWSPSYLLALDKATADALYARVPDFGGYMMKLVPAHD